MRVLSHVQVLLIGTALVAAAGCSRDRGSPVVTPPPKTTTQTGGDTTSTSGDTQTKEDGEISAPGGDSNPDDNTLVTPGSSDEPLTPATDTTATKPGATCFDELQAKFGADIIFPAQQLLPKQYEQARAQGANGQAALKTMLMSGSCAKLKANE